MQDQLHRDALPIDFHCDRVDQEGHVVVDEFNYGGRGIPAVFSGPGRENAHLWRAALEFATEGEVRERKRRPLSSVARDKVFGIDAIAILGYKQFGLLKLGSRHFGSDQYFNFNEEGGFAIFCLGGHVEFPRFSMETRLYSPEVAERPCMRSMHNFWTLIYCFVIALHQSVLKYADRHSAG